jgi:hypothetical protein
MKIKSTSQNAATLIAAGIISGALLLTVPTIAAARSFTTKKPAKKTFTKIKALVSRNNNAIRIYPDIFRRKMHVVAKDNARKEIDFFVFDLQGTLVQNYKMKPKDHHRITNMERGSYIYRVFCGDEETASGTFEIR